MSAPSLAAVTGSLRQSARRLPGADVSAHCDGGTRQLRSCILDEPIGDSGMVGRSKLRSHVREATQKRDGLDFVFRQISAPACGDFIVTTSLGGHSYSEAGA